MTIQHTAEQVLAAVKSEATAFGRCCDCYQDGFGTFCCHDCGQRTMAMLNGVQRVLGVHTKDGSPVEKMEQAEAIKAALMRRAAPKLFEAAAWMLALIDGGEEMPRPGDDVAEALRAALASARGQ